MLKHYKTEQLLYRCSAATRNWPVACWDLNVEMASFLIGTLIPLTLLGFKICIICKALAQPLFLVG